tara:strand:+ start:227 stop:994 length:768 start_codon:yes stop_codon:yes gene_type:complete
MLPKIFRPKFNYNFLRIGNEYDGGYIVEKENFFKSKMLVTAGLAFDFEFEEQYLKLNQNKVLCFDHTINFKHYFFTWFCLFIYRVLTFKKIGSIKKAFNNLMKPINLYNFLKKKNIQLKKIGLGLGEKKISLSKLFLDHIKDKDILLKIDVEGDEYRLLEDLKKFSDQILILVIEFHDADLNLKKIEDFILTFNLELIHVHPNNQGKIGPSGNPTLLEFTFAKSPKRIGERKEILLELDRDNNPKLDTINLQFET